MNGDDTRARDDVSQAAPADRVQELQARILGYEIDFRRLTGELLRLRERVARGVEIRPEIPLLLRQMNHAITSMQQAKFYAIRTQVRRLAARLGLVEEPEPPFDFLPKIFAAEAAGDAYERWRARHEPRETDFERMRRILPLLKVRPVFSIIVPTYNTPESYLRTMIESVLDQVYPDWELCIADDASQEPHVTQVLREYAARDPRIKIVLRSENGHIAKASNDALALGSGDFIALLDHDDVLARHALFEVALALNEHPEADFLYSDEDKIDDYGYRYGAFFKPDWSPDSFLTRMYTSHLGVYRRQLVDAVGGFRPGFDGSQDYDLVLRVSEQTNRIVHIPEVLYHWRVHTGSVASGATAKPYAYDAALRALNEAMDRRGEGGRVDHLVDDLGNYSVRYRIRAYQRVSVIIPTREHADDLERCLTTLFERTTYPDFEVVVLDNGSKKRSTLDLFDRWLAREPERFRVVRYDVPFNYSRINNYAARQSSGAFLLFLNNDTEILTDDWIDAMVEQAQRPSIGAVGAKLLYADDTIQHAGVVLGIGGIAGHAFRMFPAANTGYYNYLRTVNNFSAVTAACLMLRRDVFDEVGGFDEAFAVAYNDVDLCLKLGAAGYRHVYLPHVVLRHYESKSRGYDTTDEQVERDRAERELMQRKWNIAAIRDPHYNPHLTLEREDYSISP